MESTVPEPIGELALHSRPFRFLCEWVGLPPLVGRNLLYLEQFHMIIIFMFIIIILLLRSAALPNAAGLGERPRGGCDLV